ncbi:MAG: radical SAM protein [Candidatus Brocadiae bacterium]|nr:radical SAM protein [Candidatus Brocadiia bacterium]
MKWNEKSFAMDASPRDGSIFRFNPAVKRIESLDEKRFLLINCNQERLDYYPVFEEKERGLLCLFEGISFKGLKEIFPDGKAEEYIAFFQRNGYFHPMKDALSFTDKIRKSNDSYHISLYGKLYHDLAHKLELYHTNPSLPWSTYRSPVGSGNIEVSLFITDICNLSCKYCHVIDNVETKQKKSCGKIMSQETLESFAKQFIDYIKSRFKIGCLTVCFFGGQPSLQGHVRRFLYSAAEYLSQKCAEEKIYIKFSIDDNGTQIDDELIKFYKHYNFELNLSFDAPADVNSLQRPFLNSSVPSGNVVESHLKKLLECGVDVGLRATVSNHNQNRILEAIEKYCAWGLTAASFIPMQDIVHGKKVSEISSPEPNVFQQELIKALDYVLELYDSKRILFELGPVTSILHSIVSGGTIQPCGMGDIYYAVSPEGEVFTCHRDLIPEYSVCHLQDTKFLSKIKSIPESQKCSSFYSMMAKDAFCHNQECSCQKSSKNGCNECDVLIFCGGCCPAASKAQYGCRNWGVSALMDSDPALGNNRCKWSKELIRYILWKYLDAESSSSIKQYTKALFRGKF